MAAYSTQTVESVDGFLLTGDPAPTDLSVGRGRAKRYARTTGCVRDSTGCVRNSTRFAASKIAYRLT